MYTNFDHIQVELPKRQRPTLDVVKQQAEKTSQIYPDFFESLTAPKAPETSLATKKTEPKTNVETAVETPAEVAESKPVEPRREVLELWLVAQQGQAFAGEMLSTAFAKQRFSLGAKNVYCRYRENSSAMPIAFRVANGDVASGEFDVQNFAESNVQALVFFMFLSDDYHQDEANLHLMLHSAETLAQTLNGDLLTGEQKPFDETQKTQYFAQVNPVETKG